MHLSTTCKMSTTQYFEKCRICFLPN